MKDPYQILGVSPNASMDEIKSAYRKLALKYHPDRNNGSKEAEERMKEINDAYAQLTNMKKGGSSYSSGSSYSGGYQGGGYQGGYQQQNGGYQQRGGYGPYGGFDPFGFGGFGGFGGGYGQQQSQGYSSPEMQAARNYIRYGHYQEAQNLLRSMNNRTAEWYFVSAQAEYGLGNRANALDYAQRACQMEPDNFEFRRFLSQLESGSQAYRTAGQNFGPLAALLCQNPCISCILLNSLCSCCCGGRFFCC